jgi:menaquinone-dependent protoporphyrinogen oxidase
VLSGIYEKDSFAWGNTGTYLYVRENQYPVGIYMPERVLVAYASRSGSTAEIAQAIGKEFIAAGYAADITEMNNVSSLSGYQGVVIGAPLYMGNLVRDVVKFVGRHKDVLTTLPVASFAVGLTPVSEQVGNVDHAMECLHTSLSPIKPVGTILFAGRLDPAKLGFIQRKMMEFGKVPSGDFRDWKLISAWARDLPARMGLAAGTKN